jgi:hypothetical protein
MSKKYEVKPHEDRATNIARKLRSVLEEANCPDWVKEARQLEICLERMTMDNKDLRDTLSANQASAEQEIRALSDYAFQVHELRLEDNRKLLGALARVRELEAVLQYGITRSGRQKKQLSKARAFAR